VVRITSPYKLVSREHHRERSVIRVGGVPIGPDTLTVIAGPCAVETAEQTLASAVMARAAGASLLRGGAYKPRSSPYAFQGLGEAGLKILAEVRAETGLPVVTEVVDPGDVDLVASYADMLQVGTRNMQNFPLLQAVGGVGKPVMLKRGMNATIEEWLMAAEYIAQRGNLDIVLCDRDRGHAGWSVRHKKGFTAGTPARTWQVPRPGRRRPAGLRSGAGHRSGPGSRPGAG